MKHHSKTESLTNSCFFWGRDPSRKILNHCNMDELSNRIINFPESKEDGKALIADILSKLDFPGEDIVDHEDVQQCDPLEFLSTENEKREVGSEIKSNSCHKYKHHIKSKEKGGKSVAQKIQRNKNCQETIHPTLIELIQTR